MTIKITLNINLHKVLEFKNKNNEYIKNDGSCYNKVIGIIKKDMNPFFEFDFKFPEKILLMNDIDINNLKNYLFNIQLNILH